MRRIAQSEWTNVSGGFLNIQPSTLYLGSETQGQLNVYFIPEGEPANILYEALLVSSVYFVGRFILNQNVTVTIGSSL